MLTFLLQSINARATMLIGLESVLIVGSLIGTSIVVGGTEAWSVVGTAGGFLRVALVALVCQICLYYTDLYDLRIIANRRELFARTFHSLAAASIILAVVYALLPDLGVGPGVVIAATLVVMATIPGWRVVFESAVHRVSPRERLVIVGTNSAAVGLASELTERRYSLGLEIVGFVTAGAAHTPGPGPSACSATSLTFRRSSASIESIGWSSASRMRAETCRWHSCST